MNWKMLLSAKTVLWLAMGLALIGSLSHVQDTFASINANSWLSMIQAVAVDLGMVALTVDVMQKRRKNKNAVWSWVGIGVFTGISIFANTRYGLAHADAPTTDLYQSARVFWYIELWKPYLLAATLPVLVGLLAEINGEAVSADIVRQQSDDSKVLRDANRQLSAKIASLETQLEQVTAPPVSDADKALAFLKEHPDATQEEVGQALGKSRSTAGNVLRDLIESGRTKKNGHGWEVL